MKNILDLPDRELDKALDILSGERDIVATLDLKSVLDSENAKLAKLTRERLRNPSDTNRKAQVAQHLVALKAYRAYWAADDAAKVTSA